LLSSFPPPFWVSTTRHGIRFAGGKAARDNVTITSRLGKWKADAGQRKISRILDYGGDRGDLVVNLFDGAEAFVYDISGIPAAAGVTATTDPAKCKADLIINSNVLEHVGFPRLLVSEILQAAPEGGLVFLEVPCEFPFGAARIVRRLAQIGVMALTRPVLVQHVVHTASLYMMHEHINYFTEQSLTTLMHSCGGAVVASGRYSSAGMAGKADMVWCLASSTQSRPADKS
jgi:SAM-dependent methyltransferase